MVATTAGSSIAEQVSNLLFYLSATCEVALLFGASSMIIQGGVLSDGGALLFLLGQYQARLRPSARSQPARRRKNPHFKLGHHLIQLSIDQQPDCAKIFILFYS
jgi:hypothetical protein